MPKKKNPLLSDKFLDELADEINQLYGAPDDQKKDNKSDKDDK